MASLDFLKGATRGLREESMEGNLKGDYLRLMPGLCLEDRTNWYASSRWRRVIWLVLGTGYGVHVHTNRIQKGDGEIWCWLRLEGEVIRTVGRGPVAIHSSSGQTIFSLDHVEGITLDTGEQVDEVAGGASGMGVDRIGEVGDRASERRFVSLSVIQLPDLTDCKIWCFRIWKNNV